MDDAEEGGRRLKEEANGSARRHRRQARVAPRSTPPPPPGRRSLLMLSWYHDMLMLLVRMRKLLPFASSCRSKIRSESWGEGEKRERRVSVETRPGSESVAHSNPPRQTPAPAYTSLANAGADETYRTARRDEGGLVSVEETEGIGRPRGEGEQPRTTTPSERWWQPLLSVPCLPSGTCGGLGG